MAIKDVAPEGDRIVLRTSCGRIPSSLVLLVAWLGYFTVYIGRKPVAVSKRDLAANLKLSPAQLGSLDTAFLAAYTCGSFGGGALGDALGERTVLSVVLAGSSLACACFASAETPELLTAAWAFNGLMQGVPYPIYMKLLATSFGSRLASAAGVWQTSCYVGGGVGNLLAGSLLHHFSWRLAFWTPSAMLAGACVMTYFFTPIFEEAPNSPGGAKGNQGVELVTSTTPRKGSQGFRQRNIDDSMEGTPVSSHDAQQVPTSTCCKARKVLAIPCLVEVSMAYFLVKLVRYTLLFWLPYYLVNERNYSTLVAGPMSSFFELGGLIGCPLAGLATDMLANGRRFQVLMPLLMATAFLFFFYADGASFLQEAAGCSTNPCLIPRSEPAESDWGRMLFDVAILAGIGVCISGPDSIFAGPAAQDIGKHSAGILGPATVVGMVDGFGSFGSVLQGHLTALVMSTYGWTAVFRLCGLLLLLSCVLCIRPRRFEAARLSGAAQSAGKYKLEV